VATPPGKPEKDKKKKKKTHDAWISFVGRIVAQFVGAAASIFLGVYVVSRSNAPAKKAGAAHEAPAPAPVHAVSRGGDLPTIAVLPLQNFSEDPRQDYLADGMTETLIANLAQVEGLRVVSRTSSMLYKTDPKPVPQVAQELGVELVIEGSVVRTRERIRVTAQLIDAARDEHIWARTYDRRSRDVLSLQSEVAAAIVGEVSGLAIALHARLQPTNAVSPAAYDQSLHGQHAWNDRIARRFAGLSGAW
jgi:TolB-like protein